jgi:tetratricopeptide (TPR) repeat protein
MTAAPPKIKDFLATVKAQVLDKDISDNHVTFLVLIRMELVQRGVIVALDSSDDKVWEAVRSTAGKALVETTLPKPLLAGSLAISGRVVELICTHLSDSNSTLVQDTDNTCFQSAMDRCKEIPDERLEALLQLAIIPKDDDSVISAPLKSRLLLIAQGYYLRAASVQTDAPPMWKKVWDVQLERRQRQGRPHVHQPLEACVPISNLIRIAVSKENSKRAAELSLRLTESYLAKTSSALSDDDDDDDDEQSKHLIKAFIEPHRPELKDALSTLANLAKEALYGCNRDELSDPQDVFLWTLVQLRVALAQEEATIEQRAQTQYTANKNRSGSLSLETCRKKARQQILVESKEVDAIIYPRARALRDAVLEISESSTDEQPPPTFHHLLALDLVRQQLVRIRDRAQAIALQQSSSSEHDDDDYDDASSAWMRLAEYTTPIAENVRDQCGGWEVSLPKEKRNDILTTWLESQSKSKQALLSTASTLLPVAAWMATSARLDGDTTSSASSTLLLHVMSDIATCLAKLQAAQEQASAETSVVHSRAKKSDLELLRWKCARVTAGCLTSAAKCPEGILQISNEALTMYKKNANKYLHQQGEFGMAVWQCLVAWSGLHQSAWSYCSITEARRLLSRAREATHKAKSEWGRKPMLLEEALMDLAQADAEGGLLSGGFANDAAKLYLGVLEKLPVLSSSVHEVGISLLRSHCFCGMARATRLGVKLPSGTMEKSAEEYARDGLSEVERIELLEDLPPIYIWTSATDLSIRFLFSVSRQLVAESLLRSGKPEEAYSFLAAAVRDSPLDAEAAFALGSFRLRMALASEPRSPEDLKDAQVQLLKAAKLDATKANPFALLGFWFEEQKDVKRALGCYSKALAVDPANPVAGRGILRLQPYEAIKNLVEAATNKNSPLNGWAWRALGLQKVMVHDQEDLAVVALLKALRCRDVELPENESMGIFYAISPAENEKAKTFSDLANCYRKLGRYTAAIRSFHAASDAAGENVAASVLCSCAQGRLLQCKIEFDFRVFIGRN